MRETKTSTISDRSGHDRTQRGSAHLEKQNYLSSTPVNGYGGSSTGKGTMTTPTGATGDAAVIDVAGRP